MARRRTSRARASRIPPELFARSRCYFDTQRMADLADDLERAVDAALESTPTPDVGGSATTMEFTDTVLGLLDRAAA